jgi:hypothetical protein
MGKPAKDVAREFEYIWDDIKHSSSSLGSAILRGRKLALELGLVSTPMKH